MVYIFLADGFEIIEAMSPLDMLRRAKLETATVGVTGKRVTASCGVTVEADITIDEFNFSNVDAIVLPGGMPGTTNLEANEKVHSAIDTAVAEDKLVCAICAAPSILGHKGLLNGLEATCYPGFEDALCGASLSDNYVAVDGKFVTARGAGVSVDFGLEIVKQLSGEAEAQRIKSQIQCNEG